MGFNYSVSLMLLPCGKMIQFPWKAPGMFYSIRFILRRKNLSQLAKSARNRKCNCAIYAKLNSREINFLTYKNEFEINFSSSKILKYNEI